MQSQLTKNVDSTRLSVQARVAAKKKHFAEKFSNSGIPYRFPVKMEGPGQGSIDLTRLFYFIENKLKTDASKNMRFMLRRSSTMSLDQRAKIDAEKLLKAKVKRATIINDKILAIRNKLKE